MTADAETIASPQRRDTAGYRYQHGDRPLDGFTIQRGAGRGGFGEVYYALSDSGREVALKVVHTYEQIELRGIGQCMNLKSPHLVTIFDLKYGNDGRPWVIMEYVNGPSLRELLDAAPAGLGVQKAAFFLREIGKGLTELHDCGIVHRDLKPANIFFENGYVKIGDYGLSKLISGSQHSAQTMTVGTVHYMAPEIGEGRYNKQIDIYALGALLYELLTGQVPYLGSSPAEVLMKHLNSSVDTSGIEEPFATVIRKAMAKNPEDRYASVQEMVEAVFGSEHVRNSVSQFSPDSLTMVAGQAARKIGNQSDGSFTPSDTPVATPRPRFRFEDRFERMQRRVQERFGRAEERAWRKWGGARQRWGGAPPLAGDLFQRPTLDPMSLAQRITLGSMVAAIAAIAAAVLDDNGPPALFFVLFAVVGATAALVLCWRFLAPSLRHESPWLMRLVLGGAAGIASVLFTIPYWDGHGRHVQGTSMAVLLALLIQDWPARLTPGRRQRISSRHVVMAVIAGLIFSAMVDGNMILAIAAVVGTSIAAAFVVGWNPAPPRPATPAGAGAAPIITPPPLPPIPPMAPEAPTTASVPPAAPRPVKTRQVPSGVRIVWLALFIGLLTGGLALLADGMRAHGLDENHIELGGGLGMCVAAAFSYRRSRTRQFTSFWSYLTRPFLIFGCAEAILLFSLHFVVTRGINGDNAIGLLMGIVFFALVLFVILFHSRSGGSMSYPMTAVNASLAPSGRTGLTIVGIGAGLFRLLSTVAGLVVLTAALLLTAAVVSNLPGLWTTPIVDPQYFHEMTRQFGTREWPSLIRHIGAVGDFVLALIATGLLLLPRRGAGAAHMLRGLLAIGLALAAAVAFGHALPDWSEFIPGNTPAATIEIIFQSIRLPGVLTAAGLIVLAAFIFLWPPKARANTKA